MFRLYEQGPDNFSTYAECFGRDGGPGRLIATGERLVDLIDTVQSMAHDNLAVYGPGGRCEAMGSRAFFARPTVAAEQRRREAKARAQ